MLNQDVSPTKILVVDSDEASFQIRQCMAKALCGLPPLELYHARDATEALLMLDKLKPDVIVIDDDQPGERELFLDSLAVNHPPVVLQTDSDEWREHKIGLDKDVNYLPKSESLDDIHQSLILAAAIGVRFTGTRVLTSLH